MQLLKPRLLVSVSLMWLTHNVCSKFLSWMQPCNPLRDQKGFPNHVSCGALRLLTCVREGEVAYCECTNELMTWDPHAGKIDTKASSTVQKTKRGQRMLLEEDSSPGACRFRHGGPCDTDGDCFTNLKCVLGSDGEKTCRAPKLMPLQTSIKLSNKFPQTSVSNARDAVRVPGARIPAAHTRIPAAHTRTPVVHVPAVPVPAAPVPKQFIYYPPVMYPPILYPSMYHIPSLQLQQPAVVPLPF